MSSRLGSGDLEEFLGDDDGGPVVILNLIRYRPGGACAYREFVARLRSFIPEGAAVLYVGDGSTVVAAPDGPRWDAVLLVRYPSRRAFAAMVVSPGYRELAGLRAQAVEQRLLQATIPWLDESGGEPRA